ncbi:biosynthetic peptidoglycan transglycosylase [Streptomyces sp. NBC_01619]|uniref:transglycosylase domain-containing protein n=1 Tax=Streptomyces sp. NBC_01619 TaxID=2975901 RepID=UPI002B1CDF9F|nr:biosynthetic peptidoglycan transglycosylase [Streptomyces sp. NBC_01619]
MSEDTTPPRSRRGRGTKRRRLVDYPRQGREGVRRWLPSWKLLLGTFTTIVCGLVALFAAVYAYVDVPSENAAARQEANVYYWADGSQMVSVGAVNRQNVPLAKIPVSVRNAAIAAENATFYSDSGVSFSGLARAVANMARGQETQGGSTITQQYVKNTYLSQDQTMSRKVQEFCIALKIDNRKSKDDILQGYLNTSWFGRGAYGIQAAANAYYGVGVDKLNPSQSAFLAALLKGGNDYDPAVGENNRRRAVERWSWILDPGPPGRPGPDELAGTRAVHDVPGAPSAVQVHQPERPDRISRRHRQALRQEADEAHRCRPRPGRLPDPHHLRQGRGAAARTLRPGRPQP